MGDYRTSSHHRILSNGHSGAAGHIHADPGVLPDSDFSIGVNGMTLIHVVVNGGDPYTRCNQAAILKFDFAGCGQNGRMVDKHTLLYWF